MILLMYFKKGLSHSSFITRYCFILLRVLRITAFILTKAWFFSPIGVLKQLVSSLLFHILYGVALQAKVVAILIVQNALLGQVERRVRHAGYSNPQRNI